MQKLLNFARGTQQSGSGCFLFGKKSSDLNLRDPGRKKYTLENSPGTQSHEGGWFVR